jgi:hypothetical protein
MTSQEAVDYVIQQLHHPSSHPVTDGVLSKIAGSMVHKAVHDLHTRDNITAYIVFFTGVGELGTEEPLRETQEAVFKFGSDYENKPSLVKTAEEESIKPSSYAASSNTGCPELLRSTTAATEDDDLMKFLSDDSNFK